VEVSWTEEDLAVVITDDGPGFASEIMKRVGEPYVTSGGRRRHRLASATSEFEGSGLGLGFFIAKTLLERSGGRLFFENRALPAHGAIVRVRWQRSEFERSPAIG
jgi:two-component system sensor histidine kinase RegB